MRRIISALLALAMILPGGALAAKKNDKVNTFPLPELKEKYKGQRWQGEYETARKETVSVDVGIYFPDADTIGILEAMPHPALDWIKTDKINYAGFKVTGEDYYYTEEGWLNIGWPEHDLREKLDAAAKRSGEKPNLYLDGVDVVLTYGTFDLNTAYAMNNPTTVQDACDLMQTYVNRYFPREDIRLIPHRVIATIEAGKYKYYYKAKKPAKKIVDYPDKIGGLTVKYDQLIDGVPIVSRVPYNEGACYGCNLTYMTDWPSYLPYSMAFALLTKTNTVKENVSLCDPKIILQAAEELITNGRLRRVDSLRLGYYVTRDGKHKMKLTPAWAIEGLLFDNAKAEYKVDPEVWRCDAAEETTLIFDAQTGKLIDCIQYFF